MHMLAVVAMIMVGNSLVAMDKHPTDGYSETDFTQKNQSNLKNDHNLLEAVDALNTEYKQYKEAKKIYDENHFSLEASNQTRLSEETHKAQKSMKAFEEKMKQLAGKVGVELQTASVKCHMTQVLHKVLVKKSNPNDIEKLSAVFAERDQKNKLGKRRKLRRDTD